MAKHCESRTLSIFIARPFDDVYAYLAAPEHFSEWAAGLGASLRPSNGSWVADTPQGPVTIRFSEHNQFGIVDHYVVPSDCTEIYIPMRVIRNGDGSEVLFTLFHLPEMTDEQFETDASLVQQDLLALKNLLES